jgi:hypothetical protein
MRSENVVGSREDLADWCQPVMVDYLYELYGSRLGAGHTSLRVLALSHGRLWRFLILGDETRLVAARREVIGIARLAGLKSVVVDEVDQAMLSELMDVIMARFLRTPGMARSYSQIVLGAASRVATFGAAAA